MEKPNGLDRKRLQTELEACKLIAEVNQELIDRNGFTQEQLANELGSAQSYIDQSYQWEELGDRTKSDDALTDARIIILGITVLIKHILDQDSSLDERNVQQGHISV